MSNTALNPTDTRFFNSPEQGALVSIKADTKGQRFYHPKDGQSPFGPIKPSQDFVSKHFGTEDQDAIFFCDPGTDDALALFLALDHRSKIKPLMIIPSFGNVGGETTLDNTLRILSMTNAFGVAVGVGAQMPMNASECPEDAAAEHGIDGLGGATHSKPNEVEAGKKLIKIFKNGVEIAKNEIIRRYEQGGKPITLISTGSMTDVALTLQALEVENPAAIQKIAGISIMGGGIDTMQWHTNVTDYAEFNIFQDPAAARLAFNLLQKHKIPTVLAPLDLTHQTGVRETHEKKWLERHENLVAQFAAQMFKAGDFDISRSKEIYEFSKEAITRFMHDPNTITALDRPELYGSFNAIVNVVETGKKMGQTNMMNAGQNSTTQILVQTDAEGVVADWQTKLSTFEIDPNLADRSRREILALAA